MNTMIQNETKPVPKKVDCSNLRGIRQEENYNHVERDIKNDTYRTSGNINHKAYLRLKNRTKLNDKEFRDKCLYDEVFMKTAVMYISINASRQGTKDEHTLFEVCNKIINPTGNYIENLSSFAHRPTKNGEIISKEEMKLHKIDKNSCLKSFDGKITGKMKGWIFAKICLGSGGHQDNVFEEARTICDWVIKYNKKKSKEDNTYVIMDEMFVIMLDTDLTDTFNTLKKEYEDVPNILVVDHVQFQQYIINNYWEEAST